MSHDYQSTVTIAWQATVKCILSVLLFASLPTVLSAAEFTVAPTYTIQAVGHQPGLVTVPEDYTIEATQHFVTNIGGTFSGSLVNDLIGADRFYDAGYDGSGTISSNVEAGHIWGTSTGHSSLTHVTQFVHDLTAVGDVDRHATWVGQAIGGRPSTDDVRTGIAPASDLRSGAIATSWNGSAYSLSFNISTSSFYTPYTSGVTGFGAADVINSSWGLGDPTGSDFFTITIDGLAAANPNTAMVFSAGNSGPSTNTVGGSGSGYNSITVGALENDGSDSYDRVTDFSSRGPQDYDDPANPTVTGARAPVDIAAPGTNLTLAYYGGTTGGNTGGTASGTVNTFSGGLAGTSFAAPTTAGAIALMHDAAGAALPTAAHDSRVIKATLLNAADKVLQTDGSAWDNGQSDVSGVVTTTQSLDYESGAGGLNMNTTFDQYLSGQTDIAGTTGGSSSEVIGWDFASVPSVGSTVDILLTETFDSSQPFTATLTWFRDRSSINSNNALDSAFADLDLEIWDSTFTTKFAESISDYNPVEHLHFLLPQDSPLGLRVNFDEMRFGSQSNVEFGVAWSGTLVPEPGTLMLLCGGVVALAFRRRRSPR